MFGHISENIFWYKITSITFVIHKLGHIFGIYNLCALSFDCKEQIKQPEPKKSVLEKLTKESSGCSSCNMQSLHFWGFEKDHKNASAHNHNAVLWIVFGSASFEHLQFVEVQTLTDDTKIATLMTHHFLKSHNKQLIRCLLCMAAYYNKEKSLMTVCLQYCNIHAGSAKFSTVVCHLCAAELKSMHVHNWSGAWWCTSLCILCSF